jgi:PGF-CTERM protein
MNEEWSMKKTLVYLFFICCICTGIAAASAQTLGTNDATIGKQETATITISLSEAPQGLSGYNITISLINSGVADITNVEFPSWAALSYNSDLPADTVSMSAIDLNDQIGPGAGNIEFGTITVTGVAAGESGIGIAVNRIDDENGTRYTPAIEAGTIIVTGEPGEPTVTLTPGGGDGGATATPSPTPVQTAGPTGSPAVTTPGETTAPPTTEPDGGETEQPTPTSQPGFGAFLAVAGVLAAVILLAGRNR